MAAAGWQEDGRGRGDPALDQAGVVERRSGGGDLGGGEAPEDIGGEVGAVADLKDVVETRELAFELLKPRIGGNEQQDAAGGAVGVGDAEDGVEIEGAAGEEAGDVGHRARVIADAQFEDDGGRCGGRVVI